MKNQNRQKRHPISCRRVAIHTTSETATSRLLMSRKNTVPCKTATLGESMDIFIKSMQDILSPSTLRGYTTIRRNRFKAAIDLPIDADLDWQALIREESRRQSAKTVKESWAFASEIMRINGVMPPKVILPQRADNDLPFLDFEQIGTFVDAVHGTAGEIPLLLALHSLRRSEIMGLTWGKIDINHKTITVTASAVFDENNKLIYKQTTKNTSSRRIIPIMIPELLAALSADKQKHNANDHVVVCSPNTIWAWSNRICRQCGLPEVGIHGLRRSFASLGFHLGWPERVTMELGGWKSAQVMHRFYIKLATADKLKRNNEMADFYENRKIRS